MSKRVGYVILACLLAVVLLVGLLALAGCAQQAAVSQRLQVIQHTFHSAVVTNTNGAAMDVSQLPKVGIQVEGIVTATVTFQGTIDNETWYAVEAVNRNDGSKSTSTTSDGIFSLSVAEFKMVRCPISSWVSGTITVKAIGLESGIADPADVAVSDITTGTVDVANVVDVAIADANAYTTPTHTVISVTTSSSVALAANANRLYALLVNDSDTEIYIKLGATAVANQGIRLNAFGGSYEMSAMLGNLYTGAINAIHAGTGNKVLLLTEGM